MSRPRSLLYLGPNPQELTSFLPAEWVGTVAGSRDAARHHLRSCPTDCLVVDSRVSPVEPETVVTEESSPPVVLLKAPESSVESVPDHVEAVVDDATSPSDRRQTVQAVSRATAPIPNIEPSTLTTSEHYWHAILEAVPQAVVVVTDGQITHANRRAETLLDIDHAAAADGAFEQLSGTLYDESGTELDRETFPFSAVTSEENVLLRYVPPTEGEKTGERWLLVDGEPVPSSVETVVVALTDLTRIKAQQQQLRQQKADLDTVVEELRRSNAELEQFAYVASHDMRQPLRMISNYLGLLERRYGDELDEDATDFIDFAIEGAQRMRQFINDLLEYSRVGREQNTKGPVALEDVLETVRQNLSVTLGECDADLIVADLPTVWGNEYRLEQLFQNLVENAIKYAGESSPTIRIDAVRDDGRYEVTVADDGVGIDADRQDDVFDLFETSGADNSTGIGLALCRKIVENHGGDIWLESTLGEGTTVHVTLAGTNTEAETNRPADVLQRHDGPT